MTSLIDAEPILLSTADRLDGYVHRARAAADASRALDQTAVDTIVRARAR